jgi:hypothetical protein
MVRPASIRAAKGQQMTEDLLIKPYTPTQRRSQRQINRAGVAPRPRHVTQHPTLQRQPR